MQAMPGRILLWELWAGRHNYLPGRLILLARDTITYPVPMPCRDVLQPDGLGGFNTMFTV